MRTKAQQVVSNRAALIALAYEMYGFEFGSLATIGKPRVEVGTGLGLLLNAIHKSQVVEIYKHPQTHEWMIELNTAGDHPVARAVGVIIVVGRERWEEYAAAVYQYAHVPQWNGFGYGDDTGE